MERSQMPTPADVREAADRVRPYVRRTPLLDVEIDGRRTLLKLEHLQRSGSFKLRGAVNALLTATKTAGAPAKQVVAASGGNHGLAVATAAELLGVEATIYVPEGAPAAKTRRIEAAGARLVRHGATFAEAAGLARETAAEHGHPFLHAYDDPAVVAGQGTAGVEIVADAPGADTVVVATGGGGLAAGTALAADGRRLVTVEPEGCPCLYDALAAGRPVDAAVDSIAASALGASRVGEVPFGILSAYGVESLLVDDGQLLRARDRLWDECRIAVELAAAAPFAAWLAGRVPGDLPCLVLCGANSDWTPS